MPPTSKDHSHTLPVKEPMLFSRALFDFKYFLRSLLAKAIPARAPQNYDHVDLVTRHHIRVRSSPGYVIFSVNERDFYWNRWSGKFDGTGSDLCYEHPGKSDVEPIKIDLPFEMK